MPRYQYTCTACGHDLEAVQSFSDEPLRTCPECGGALRKVFSAVGVVFKGSGFYRTDSRSSGKPAAAKAQTSTASGSDKAAASSGTSKGSSGGSSSTEAA